MLEQLFKYPGVLARHQAAPLADERERYLTHQAAKGLASATLRTLACQLCIVAQALPLSSGANLTCADIERAAERRIPSAQTPHDTDESRARRMKFIRLATAWLQFLGRMQAPVMKVNAFAPQLSAFRAAMLDERGLAVKTIRSYEWFIGQFFDQFGAQHRSLATVTIHDVDTFLTNHGQHWCRVSVATAAKALRAFFRYAEQQQWCCSGIAIAIESPRLFKQETLPTGPDWDVVQRLIEQTDTDQPRDIRDRAILLLLAMYGLRSGEVATLELEQFDWSHQRLTVRRPKQRLMQEYPLVAALGTAVVRYLKEVRPRCSRREVFLTLRAPVRPLSGGALYHLTRQRLARLGYAGPHYGPHTLRYACATHLLTQQLSLKEIGDHLGHRSAYATRIYAKVDLEMKAKALALCGVNDGNHTEQTWTQDDSLMAFLRAL